jgi:hypothetical protein
VKVLFRRPCRRAYWRAVLLVLLLAPLGSAAELPLKIQPVGEESPRGFSRTFSKRVDVFGIPVFATTGTPDAKVLHAANVLAQYLDNNADGQPDNAQVHAMMKKNRAGIMMTATERSFERLDVHRYIPERIWDAMIMQGLFGEETLPGWTRRGRFDATLEEVLHLITHAGYAHVYPEVFGERPGTQIAKAMDLARGGHFRRVPRSYPAGAWYTYDDRSCDYGCQVTEYTYWGLTSILGAQDYPGRNQDIGQEWRLNTRDKVKQRDPTLYRLLTDPRYRFPSILPDGKYRPQPHPSN